MSDSHYLKSRLPEGATADITGNASVEIKELPIKWFHHLRGTGNGFASPILSRVKVTDVSILPSTNDPLRLEGKLTCEIDVTPDMCNQEGKLAQGCLFSLLDEGTNISMVIASAGEGKWQSIGVSQTINVAFHAIAVAGTKLRLVHSSIAESDSQIHSARSEIWDATNHRLVASGTQLSMRPSKGYITRMGLGQSKQPQWNVDPRYRYQQPHPVYMPLHYAQPVYPHPQPGFIPPVYGQAAILPPTQLHYFPGERQSRPKPKRHTREDSFTGGFIPPRDRRSPPEPTSRRAHSAHRPREAAVAPDVPSPPLTRRMPTPFIPRMAEEEEEEEDDRPRSVPPERVRPPSRQSPIHYDQPPTTVHGDISVLQPMPPPNRSAFGPSGQKPLTPLRNPLPPPPKDLYEMSPYKSLLTLPQTTALLTATRGPQKATVTMAPLAPNPSVKRNKSIFRAFSRKNNKPQPEQQNPLLIPVFLPASSQPQQPLNQTQPPQSEARPPSQLRFQSSQQRPFAGAGPRDIFTPTTAEFTSRGFPTGETYQFQDDSGSVSNEAFSPPIPPHPTNPPTVKFDQTRSYTQFMNHSPHRVMWKGLTYPTALHLHEALKFLDHRPDIAEMIRKCSSVHDVYPLSAKYVEFQRPDWGDQFLPLMEDVLYVKFRQHPDLRTMLLGTGNADLEYADAVDDYWGSGLNGQGENQLGKVLTRVREQLREDSTP